MAPKKCPFCKINMNRNGIGHIYPCGRRHGFNSKKEIKYQYAKYSFPEIAKKQLLYQKYVKELYSLPDLLKEYGINFSLVVFLLEYFDIPNRSMSESAQKISKNKYKKTMMERYGIENALQKDSKFYKKRNETVKKRYGVDNVFQSQVVKDIIFGDEIWIKKYGITRKKFLSRKGKEVWANLTDDQRNTWLENSILKSEQREGFFTSKMESRVQVALSNSYIKSKHQFEIRSEKRRYYFDFRLDKTNVLIEVNGDYWHANPNKYKAKQKLNFHGKLFKAEDIWDRDKDKRLAAEKRGFVVLYLWEEDIALLSEIELKDFVKEKIDEFVKNNHEKVSKRS